MGDELLTLYYVQELELLFQELDPNNDGIVTFEEFYDGFMAFKEASNAAAEEECSSKLLTLWCCSLNC